MGRHGELRKVEKKRHGRGKRQVPSLGGSRRISSRLISDIQLEINVRNRIVGRRR